MGEKFPPTTTSSRTSYVVKKLQEQRNELLRQKDPQHAQQLKVLCESPFVLPPTKPRGRAVQPSPVTHGTTQPSLPVVTRSSPILKEFSPPLTSTPIISPSTSISPPFIPSQFLLTASSTSSSYVPSPQPILMPRPILPTASVKSPNYLKRKLSLTRARELRKDKRIKTLKLLIRHQSKTITHIHKQKERQRTQQNARFQKLMFHRKKHINRATQTNMSCSQCERYEHDLEEEREKRENYTQRGTCSFITDGKYNSNFIHCVITLLNLNVANHHVSPVIEAVLKLLNIEAPQLPCRATVENMAKMRKPLIDLQIQEELRDEENTTLYTDGTTKFGNQYETYVITTADHKPKILGIKEVPDKAANTCFNTFRHLLDDLNGISSQDTGKKIISSIRNTMSDRAATEICFENLFDDFRQQVLPSIVPQWEELDHSTRQRLSQTHHFFCGLHLLVNCAERVNKSLHRIEQQEHGDLPLQYGHENSVVTFVRAVCKAFSRGGDEKSGYHSQISSFLASRGLAASFTPFRGNRFNILFHNAAVIYHLHRHISEFIDFHIGVPNLLIKAVKDGLGNTFVIAGCRALGLIDKFLTKPLWDKLEEPGSVLDMNSTYSLLVQNLDNANIHSILTGDAVLISDFPPDDGSDSFKSLVSSCDNDILTESILSVLIPDIAILLKKLVTDHLPAGKHHEKNEDSNPECLSAMKHNKLPETVFGRLNYTQRRKPSASMYSVESAIQYNFNKVSLWLDNMSGERREELLNSAAAMRDTYFQKYKERKEEIKVVKLAAVEKLREEKDRKRRKLNENKIKNTQEIVRHGLWQTHSEVDERLKTYRTRKEKLEAVKIQLCFRKLVLKQIISDSNMFKFSEKGRSLPLRKLTENLKVIISEAGNVNTNQSQLSGKRVSHRFEEDGELTEYCGRVISQVPGFPAWFNIVYDSEPETVYTFQLEDDIAAGDLRILIGCQLALKAVVVGGVEEVGDE